MPSLPAATEYAPFYAGYVDRVADGDILETLATQPTEVRRFAASVPAEREGHRYAPGKWSVREVLGHLGDGERVFGYRALRFARGDETPVPGFDENVYIARSGYDGWPLAELVAAWAAQRESNLAVFRHLDDDAWLRMGTANGQPVSVRALAYLLAGHVAHHLTILRERYEVG